MRFSGHLDNVWRFGPGPTTQAVTVRGARGANDGALMRQWALAGHAIILTSKLDVGPDIRAGRLAELLAGFAPPSPPLHMLFPPSRARPRRVRAGRPAGRDASRAGAGGRDRLRSQIQGVAREELAVRLHPDARASGDRD
jgi:DNA-binding transcriptional LysR family regulator